MNQLLSNWMPPPRPFSSTPPLIASIGYGHVAIPVLRFGTGSRNPLGPNAGGTKSSTRRSPLRPPAGPAGPAGPVAPVAPVAPVGPAGPAGPAGPVAPVG